MDEQKYKCPINLVFGMDYNDNSEDCMECPISSACFYHKKPETKIEKVCPYGGIFGFSRAEPRTNDSLITLLSIEAMENLWDACTYCDREEECEDIEDTQEINFFLQSSICFAGIVTYHYCFYPNQGFYTNSKRNKTDLSPFVLLF